MEQRRLRLGDILDDYCPRERRVTNHAVVAMIEEDVRQTRCTTCDAEHAYKGARVPRRRKKETPATLFKDVLAGLPEVTVAPSDDTVAPVPDAPSTTVRAMSESAPRLTDPDVTEEPPPEMQSEQRTPHSSPPAEPPAEPSAEPRKASQPPAPVEHAGTPDDGERHDGERPDVNAGVDEPSVADGPVHRRLIRATLPRPEGQKDARPLPEFTVRQSPGRNGGGAHYRGERMRGRGGQSAGQGEPNGNRAHGHHGRGPGGRSPGGGRQPSGRAGGPGGFRGSHPKGGRRGRGSR
jgi:hypothetical protein